MWVAIPVRLEFHLDKNFHTVSISEKFKTFNDRSELSSSVQASIGETSDIAMNSMFKSVDAYIKQIIGVNTSPIRSSDFTLIYNLQEAKLGLFWSTPGVVQYRRLK